jgi:hypothetical protein
VKIVWWGSGVKGDTFLGGDFLGRAARGYERIVVLAPEAFLYYFFSFFFPPSRKRRISKNPKPSKKKSKKKHAETRASINPSPSSTVPCPGVAPFSRFHSLGNRLDANHQET